MADQKELDKLSQAEEFFNRYFQFEDAVQVSKENKEYLKTYIHLPEYVTKSFNFKAKFTKSIITSAIAGAGAFLLLFLITGFELSVIWIPIVAFAVVFIIGCIVGYSMNKYRLSAALQHQVEINNGISEQIQILEERIKEREKHSKDYYKELQKRITFISMDYMKYIPQIKEILISGEAETCEEAIEVFEQQLLMKKMTQSLNKPATHTEEENKERFGDPLEMIMADKKKKKKNIFSK